nr:translation elongation factor 1-alpha [Ipomoea batatas]GMC59382.1 translation elongation factor 1-alpha [Ipomoea batatas]GMC90180.1 translation elongation factor 1-alpha [Ipomoea batatas]GMD25341.1 translation elongation factor 1-alpha [Ipomoea batatas]GME11717.1 translation elongation factor 1-alpha [Ipomoea batatas]
MTPASNHDKEFNSTSASPLEWICQCIQEPYMAESMAMKEVLGWIKNSGLTNVRLEIDCLVICSSLSDFKEDRSYAGSITPQCSLLLLSSLGDLGTSWVLLVNALNDSNSDGLTHVPHSKTPQWWVLREGLDDHGLCGKHLHETSITVLQELGLLLELLARSSIDLGHQLSKLDSNVGSVAVENRSITVTNLTRVVHDDNLGGEVGGSFRWVILRVGSNVTTLEILHSNILHVESNIVTRKSLLKSFMVHLNRLNFSGQARRSEGDNHTRLEDTSLHTTHRDSSNTTNFVHILEWETEGLVRGPLGLINHIKSIKEGWALVPVKVGGPFNHVITLKTRDWDEWDLLRVVSNLFQVG